MAATRLERKSSQKQRDTREWEKFWGGEVWALGLPLGHDLVRKVREASLRKHQ